jgi:CMP-N,N'-diacetyllegionaminic acid synthase
MASGNPSIVAMIPARAGSKRVVGKNVRRLGEHPLIAYSIAAAVQSGVFGSVIVSTDSEEYAAIARHYGAEVPFLRPPELAADTSPDIEWVAHALKALAGAGRPFDCFSILRPTSPFRKAETVRRAWAEFRAQDGIDSLRAVEKCGQHPGKMWVVRGERMSPLMPLSPAERPWHSMQYQALPEVYVQNASLEIAWSRVALEQGTIAGQVLMPFLTQGDEGLDVNTERDWWYTEHLLNTGAAALLEIGQRPWKA